MRRFLGRLAKRFRARPPRPAVRVDDEGVGLLDGGEERLRFAWAEVRQVATYKRDCLVYDDIRLVFLLDDSQVEVSEAIEGWSDLTAAVRRRFPTIPPDWYGAVMCPPFEPCARVLWERGAGAGAGPGPD